MGLLAFRGHTRAPALRPQASKNVHARPTVPSAATLTLAARAWASASIMSAS